jgi:murein DD-endopeptidase MepM/ murein hydrolase activator NlpD
MNRFAVFFLFLVCSFSSKAQLAEVQANYNNAGDVDFIAYNNTASPLFIHIEFADMENARFNESLPYIKLLEPGFNTLFTLLRDPGAGVPRFNYQIKTYRSNPFAFSDLDFPYLIPFAPGEEARVFDVKSMEGFMGTKELPSFNATGFIANPRQKVFAARTGTVVEVAGTSRSGEPLHWYHTWYNTITLLQPDGTLISYRNVIDPDKKLKPGVRVAAGQPIGIVAPGTSEVILVIFQHSLNSDALRFMIPQFVTGENETGMLLSSQVYPVVHPSEVRGLELTKKEKRLYLK